MFYLEDLSAQMVFELGKIEVLKDEIIRFAETFDPQPFHVDEDVAKELYGGLIASGWHTASLCNLLAVRGFMSKTACLASPGIDNLLFLKPVYAGDVLHGRMTVGGTRVLKSKPDRGIVQLETALFRDDDVKVLSMVGNVIVKRRNK